MSHDAATRSLATLRAAKSGIRHRAATTGPGKKLLTIREDPVRINVPKPAQNAEEARKLWEIRSNDWGGWPSGERKPRTQRVTWRSG